MHFYCRWPAALLLACLLGCAQAPSKRVATTGPIQAVRVLVWVGTDTALRDQGIERVVATLQRNGLPVTGSALLARPLADLAALESTWNAAPAGRATHALVLTEQRRDGVGAAQYVRYEAVLWDAGSHQLVWQGTLASAANTYGVDVSRREDRLAGDILRGLARDGLFVMPRSAPVDDAGIDIPPTLVPLQIR